ncbi:MAG: trehalose-phosphatase [Planctomycetaceae bacterium]
MNAAFSAALEGLAADYDAGRDLLLLFDYDGTLVPIAPYPALATLSQTTRQLLGKLASLSRVTVGVVSSRALAELTRLVDLPGLFYAGSGGLEVEFHGRRWSPEINDLVLQSLADLSEAVEAELAGFAGAWLERKPLGFALHYRNLDAVRHGALRTAAWGLVERFRGLRCVDAALALEITPDVGWSKGTAVELALEHAVRSPCTALYAGDEANDAEAVAVMNARGGVTVGVGPQAPPAVQHRLPDPAALAAAMESLRLRLEPAP